MNWFVRIKYAMRMLKMAEPHCLLKCPGCQLNVFSDLLYEKRQNDPTLQVYDLNGEPTSVEQALTSAANVSRWESKERFHCLKCKTVWYSIVTRRINPVFDAIPEEHIISIGNDPPAGGPFHDAAMAA